MEDTSSSCKLCNKEESKYVCPRCNIPYCSLLCYQSERHLQCSESFYREAVVDELKNNELDPDSQKNMLEILQRVQQIDNQFEEEELLDSDDESEGEELADRLAGVDLDDADQVWDRLTAEERRQFEELLKSGDVSEVVPTWQPWWCYKEKKVLVKELKNELPDDSLENKPACPQIVQNIKPLSQLTKVTPSPCVRWCVVNVLAGYSITARLYNGDHQNAAQDAAMTLLTLCSSLATSQLFESPELAVADVHMAAVNNNCLVEGVDVEELKSDVQKLVEGPSESRKSDYVLAALSDIHVLFVSAKRKAKESRSAGSKGEFSKKFPNATSLPTNSSATAVTDLNKHIKKIEFYLSWTVECF